eukprot:scaffold462_cov195-Pinguiococcus_pyrenoidosus.AAC.42
MKARDPSSTNEFGPPGQATDLSHHGSPATAPESPDLPYRSSDTAGLVRGFGKLEREALHHCGVEPLQEGQLAKWGKLGLAELGPPEGGFGGFRSASAMEIMMKVFRREEECDRVKVREVAVPYDPTAEALYCDNTYTTAIYSWYDFFPRALLGQFRRTGNQYFLAMIVVMSIGTYTAVFQSPINPSTIGLPLLVVLLISMAQQGG